jgi:co-chaperonin GroES (HSP10)
MELKALEDRLILQEVKKNEETTSSGLVMIAQDDGQNEAIIVAVGEGHRLPSGIQLDVPFNVGDKVIFNPMAVQYFENDGQEYIVSFMKDILAIIEEN